MAGGISSFTSPWYCFILSPWYCFILSLSGTHAYRKSTAKISSSVNRSGQHIQTLLHGRRIRGCERCLVELADDRLRRATRQEDGEPGWRFKIRKPLLMSTGQTWQGRVYSRPQGRDFVVLSFFEGETDGSEEDADGFETN